jgi:hypothetical protein
MRATVTLLAALGSLAACETHSPPQPVATSPPSISYEVYGNDMAQANGQADVYCEQYGQYANLQSVQPNGARNVATYTCGGSRVSGAAPYYGSAAPASAPPPYSAAVPYNGAPPAIRCADPLHQDLPGGTDYRGPPVSGCP